MFLCRFILQCSHDEIPEYPRLVVVGGTAPPPHKAASDHDRGRENTRSGEKVSESQIRIMIVLDMIMSAISSISQLLLLIDRNLPHSQVHDAPWLRTMG